MRWPLAQHACAAGRARADGRGDPAKHHRQGAFGAELRPNQTDQDSLPPYPVLDDILECLVENEMGVDEIVDAGHDRETVERVEHLLYIAEYKRRQARRA
jgi:NH3-dependent NAD+ synthetase